jgi:hypothetical protein
MDRESAVDPHMQPWDRRVSSPRVVSPIGIEVGARRWTLGDARISCRDLSSKNSTPLRDDEIDDLDL